MEPVQVALVAECIRAGQTAGEIDTEYDPFELATLFFSGLEGVRMQMGVERKLKPMDIFVSVLFDRVLLPRQVCLTK